MSIPTILKLLPNKEIKLKNNTLIDLSSFKFTSDKPEDFKLFLDKEFVFGSKQIRTFSIETEKGLELFWRPIKIEKETPILLKATGGIANIYLTVERKSK